MARLRPPLRPFLVGLAAAAVVVGSARAADEPAGVDDFRAKLAKWVETRQLISRERSDWEVERETLAASRDLLKQQKESLEAYIRELEETSTAGDDERRDLLLRRGEYQRVNELLAQRIRGLEESVLALAKRLPEPLRERLEVLLVQIPEDPEKATGSLGQRITNVLGVLVQADKFNTTATFVGETRPIGDQQVQVRTLYWGLGQAFYVDSKGETAGIGRPGEAGWDFSTDESLAGDAKRLLDIYEGNVDVIRFVELPVEIQ